MYKKSKKEFCSLGFDIKIQILLEDGEKLLERIFLYYEIYLYALGDFYVELWCRQNSHRIDKIVAVDIDEIFHIYENQIDLNKLLD
ncbi:MAG: hypothetical protein ACEPOW_09040 [Bacteroidales bacterium]